MFCHISIYQLRARGCFWQSLAPGLFKPHVHQRGAYNQIWRCIKKKILRASSPKLSILYRRLIECTFSYTQHFLWQKEISASHSMWQNSSRSAVWKEVVTTGNNDVLFKVGEFFSPWSGHLIHFYFLWMATQHWICGFFCHTVCGLRPVSAFIMSKLSAHSMM